MLFIISLLPYILINFTLVLLVYICRCPSQTNQQECISTSGQMYAHTHVRAYTCTNETKESHTDLGSNFSGAISWKHLTVSVKRSASYYTLSLYLLHELYTSPYSVRNVTFSLVSVFNI